MFVMKIRKKNKAEHPRFGADTIYIIRHIFSISFPRKYFTQSETDSLPEMTIQYNIFAP